jgi:HK97 family phage portal protein
MPIVQSGGELTRLAKKPLRYASSSGGGASFPGLGSSYAAIYATQSNVRTCVDFLSRNMAQIGLHGYRRVSDTDREHLSPDTSPLAKWIERPNPFTTAYGLMEGVMGDLGIYFNAYLWKLRVVVKQDFYEAGVPFRAGEARVMLVRLPPEEIWPDGYLMPRAYAWHTSEGVKPLDANDVIAFRGYNPLDSTVGLSPLETLRRLLATEEAAATNREAYWANASRIEGVIERPRDAPKWTRDQKQEWRRQWAERYQGPANAGLVPVLEDGMTWKATAFSSEQSEYIASRKLTREECASAYHIPLPMVGILEHATFSNIKEQHKQLYADTMGPWCQMVQQQFELGLLMEIDDPRQTYFEFNIAEKLKGSFEEQTSSLRVSVGRPFMTANEARARLNLPRIADDPTADQLAAQQGGPAGSGAPMVASAAVPVDDTFARIVRASWERQASRVNKEPRHARAEAFDVERAICELAEDLGPILGARAVGYAGRIAAETYKLLADGGDAFAESREVPPCTIH